MSQIEVFVGIILAPIDRILHQIMSLFDENEKWILESSSYFSIVKKITKNGQYVLLRSEYSYNFYDENSQFRVVQRLFHTIQLKPSIS